MKHLLFATTALVAVTSVAPAFADISVSGHTRFTYDTGENADDYNPDFNVWVKAEEVSDTGLTYGGAVRFTPDDVDEAGSRHYMYLSNELGKLTLGKHHGPAYTMSLGSDWRGTVSAKGKATTPIFQGHTTPRIIYHSPNVGGFQFGTSVSSGSDSLGAETQTGLNYTMHLNESMIRLAHNRSSVGAVGGSPFGSEAKETGIEFTHGKFMASFVSFNKTEARTFTHTSNPSFTSSYTVVTEVPDGMNEFGEQGFESFLPSCDEQRVTIDGESYLSALRDCSTGHLDMVFVPGDVRYDWDTGTYHYTDPSRPYLRDSASNNLHHPGAYETTTVTYFSENTPGSTSYSYDQQTTSGQEIELAYFVNDDMTVNLVNYSDDQDYDRLSLGVKYTFAPNITASLSHSSIDNAGVDEDAMRFRLNYSF